MNDHDADIPTTMLPFVEADSSDRCFHSDGDNLWLYPIPVGRQRGVVRPDQSATGDNRHDNAIPRRVCSDEGPDMREPEAGDVATVNEGLAVDETQAVALRLSRSKLGFRGQRYVPHLRAGADFSRQRHVCVRSD